MGAEMRIDQRPTPKVDALAKEAELHGHDWGHAVMETAARRDEQALAHAVEALDNIAWTRLPSSQGRCEAVKTDEVAVWSKDHAQQALTEITAHMEGE